jgi:hypothetical protein
MRGFCGLPPKGRVCFSHEETIVIFNGPRHSIKTAVRARTKYTETMRPWMRYVIVLALSPALAGAPAAAAICEAVCSPGIADESETATSNGAGHHGHGSSHVVSPPAHHHMASHDAESSHAPARPVATANSSCCNHGVSASGVTRTAARSDRGTVLDAATGARIATALNLPISHREAPRHRSPIAPPPPPRAPLVLII